LPEPRANGFRALLGPIRLRLECWLTSTDQLRIIGDAALEQLKSAIESGKIVAEWTGDRALDIAQDPKLRAAAINLIVQGLIEAGYLYGGRLGGRMMEGFAGKLAERTLIAMGINAIEEQANSGEGHRTQTDIGPEHLSDDVSGSSVA
jgi:hypothetical protein